MTSQDNGKVSIVQISGVVIGIVTVVIAGAGLGYYFGRDSASSEVSALQRDLALLTNSKAAVEIFESLETLKSANENLFRFKQHAEEINEYEEKLSEAIKIERDLESDISTLNTRITKLDSDLEIMTGKADKLGRQLRQKYSLSQNFKLEEKQATSFFDGEVNIGLKSNFGRWVNIRILDTETNLDVGEYYPFGINGSACRLTYSGVAEDGSSGNFSLNCS